MTDVVTSSGLDLAVLTKDQRDLIEDLTAHAGGARKAGLPRAARWRADRFQNVREALEDAGWINVQRGIMTLAPVENRVAPPPRLDRISNEADFEEPAMKIMEHMATGALGLAEGTYKILNTARAGRRETGGRWSRPDLTLVTVERYKWLRPQHRLRVMTCELKLGTQLDVSAVHEALAHRA